MTGWALINVFSQLLDRDEREAVQGDLVEAGQSAWQSLFDILGLVVRRQAGLWRNWRPWLATFVALPSTLTLMGYSVWVSQTYFKATGPTSSPGFALLMCNIVLLIAWAWTGGFVVGSLSRRTIWISAALCCLPCLFCLARFRIESLSRFSLFLFVLPAIWGACRGVQITRIKLSSAILLAVAVTAFTIPRWNTKGSSIPTWALSWPAWYLVVTARKPVSL